MTINYPRLGVELKTLLAENGFADRDGQVLNLAEEVGEFVGAYRRWTDRARRSDTLDHVEEELADVVITAFVTAAVLDIDIEKAVDAKVGVVLTRGWKESA